jgi:hypothetical protein
VRLVERRDVPLDVAAPPAPVPPDPEPAAVPEPLLLPEPLPVP